MSAPGGCWLPGALTLLVAWTAATPAAAALAPQDGSVRAAAGAEAGSPVGLWERVRADTAPHLYPGAVLGGGGALVQEAANDTDAALALASLLRAAGAEARLVRGEAELTPEQLRVLTGTGELAEALAVLQAAEVPARLWEKDGRLLGLRVPRVVVQARLPVAQTRGVDPLSAPAATDPSWVSLDPAFKAVEPPDAAALAELQLSPAALLGDLRAKADGAAGDVGGLPLPLLRARLACRAHGAGELALALDRRPIDALGGTRIAPAGAALAGALPPRLPYRLSGAEVVDEDELEPAALVVGLGAAEVRIPLLSLDRASLVVDFVPASDGDEALLAGRAGRTPTPVHGVSLRPRLLLDGEPAAGMGELPPLRAGWPLALSWTLEGVPGTPRGELTLRAGEVSALLVDAVYDSGAALVAARRALQAAGQPRPRLHAALTALGRSVHYTLDRLEALAAAAAGTRTSRAPRLLLVGLGLSVTEARGVPQAGNADHVRLELLHEALLPLGPRPRRTGARALGELLAATAPALLLAEALGDGEPATVDDAVGVLVAAASEEGHAALSLRRGDALPPRLDALPVALRQAVAAALDRGEVVVVTAAPLQRAGRELAALLRTHPGTGAVSASLLVDGRRAPDASVRLGGLDLGALLTGAADGGQAVLADRTARALGDLDGSLGELALAVLPAAASAAAWLEDGVDGDPLVVPATLALLHTAVLGRGALPPGEQPQCGPLGSPPEARATVSPDRLLRGDDHSTLVTLDATWSGGDGLAFSWLVPDGRLVAGSWTDPRITVSLPGTRNHPFSVTVANEVGSDTASGTVPLNRRPWARIALPARARPGEPLVLDGAGSEDADGDRLDLRWRILRQPEASGAVLELPASERPSLTPDVGGLYRFGLVVSDGLAESEEARAAVLVTDREDLEPPSLAVTVEPSVVATGEPVLLTVVAADATGIVAQELSVAGEPLGLEEDAAVYTPEADGRYEVRLVATDGAGNTEEARASFHAHSRPQSGPPTVQITAPGDGETLADLTEVRGTLSDDDLAWYAVEVSARGAGIWTRLAEGGEPVADGVLGTIDTTALSGGLYDLRVVAEDAWGRRSASQVLVEASSGLGFGASRLSFVDASLPLLGVNIEIRRAYDSGRKEPGDFGMGWDMEVSAGGRLEQTNPPGEGWVFVGDCVFQRQLYEQQSHVVVVSIGGRSYRFRFEPQVLDCAAGLVHAEPYFTPLPGTRAALIPGGGVADIFLNRDRGSFYGWDLVELYDPEEYYLETEDGWFYRYHREHGLLGVEDPHGNRIAIDEDGIRHSCGASLSIDRDEEGRVTAITLPDGETRSYVYDGRGDLVSAADFEGYETAFRYDLRHNLGEVVDPRGEVPLSMEYDETGRITAYVSAAGERIEIDHDGAERVDVVTDALGNRSVYGYDALGNVVSSTDPLGGVTTSTYDETGNRLSETDPLGGRTEWEYDAAGRLVRRTDPLGRSRTWTYDEQGRVLTETDEAGRTTVRTWSEQGEPLTVTDPEGNVTRHEYDEWGNRVATTDAEGHVTRFEYDDAGRLARRTDALGHGTTMSVDELGNRVSETVTWTGPDGPRPLTTRHEHDAMGRRVVTTDAGGHTTRYEYDEIGLRVATVDAVGRRTRLEYDGQGRVVRKTYPDGTTELWEHDAAGHPVARTDRAGRRWETTYDALGRPVRVTRPDGRVVRNEYDAAGRLVRSVDPLGHETRSSYDAAGRLTETRNPLGEVTRFEYDAAGNRAAITGPAGHTTRLRHDGNDRLVGREHPDGSVETVSYDGLGREVAMVDQAGRRTTWSYDAGGRLVTVTDPLGQEVHYAYDELGSVVARTDANGHTSRLEVDASGRLVGRIRPLGRIETLVRDAVGRVVERTDGEGRTTRTAYDDADRPVLVELPDGGVERIAWTPSGRRASFSDARGVTRWTWDAGDRLLARTDPDGTVVRYEYDAAGRRTTLATPAGEVRYDWDAAGRLVRVTDPADGETTYEHDAAGNLAAATLPNGVRTVYAYDALHRLTGVETTGADLARLAAWSYELDETGQRVRVEEAHRDRVVEYAYDALRRLLRERITMPDAPPQVIEYTYDAAGNRLSRDDSDGARVEYAYDANDRLLRAGPRTLSWDGNGNLAGIVGPEGERSFELDTRNRLRRVEADGQVVGYVYDADGLRVERHVDGSLETRYVLDTATRHAQVVAELDERGAVTAGYVHGHGPIRQQAGAVRYPVQDGQGSVRLLSGPEGAVSDTFDFDAFGVLLARTGVSDAPYGYVREVRDPSTGLYDLRARWLDPALGRFLGEDPVQPVSRAPLTLHRYAYALNDPVNRWDPSGRFSAALMAPVGMLQIISIVAIQSLLPFVITLGVIDRLMKPGFALRYGAMELLAASDHPGVYRYAMRMYRMGGQLIGAGGGLIRLTFSICQFAHNFRLLAKSIRGIVTDWGSWPAVGVWAVGIGARLSNLDRAAGGLHAGFSQLARAIRQRQRRRDSRLDDLVEPLAEDLHAYFGTARSLLLSGR